MTGRNTLTKIAGGAIKSDDKGEQAAQAVAKPVSFELDAELIDELIENFLVAVHRDKLRVKVQGQAIDKSTLKKFVTEDAANYYKILTGDDSIKRFEFDVHDMGKLKLGVLLDPTTKLNRRVLIVCKSGMKLFELDRFSRTLNFTAILELEGLKLNAFFCQTETPDHTNWEPSRHPTFFGGAEVFGSRNNLKTRRRKYFRRDGRFKRRVGRRSNSFQELTRRQ